MKSKIGKIEDEIIPISEMKLRPSRKSRRVPQLPDHARTKSEKSKTENYLTPNEFTVLQTYLMNNGTQRDRNILMCQLIFETGLRVSDMLSIRPKDINFIRRYITAYVHKSDLWSNKPISMELGYALSIYINQNKIQPEEQIINLTRTQVWNIITEAGKAALHRRVTPHTLRHTVAMAIRNNGGTYDDVKDTLDHASVHTSEDFYAEADIEKKRQILIQAGILRRSD